MKKLILLILLIPSLLFAGNIQQYHRAVLSQTVASGGGSCTESSENYHTQTLNQDYWTFNSTWGQNFQEVDNNASAEITICQVDMVMYTTNTGGDVYIRIMNTAGDTQYGSDSNAVSVTNTGTSGEVKSFTFAIKPTVAATTDFRIEFKGYDTSVNGAVRVGYPNPDYPTDAADATYTLTASNNERTTSDAYFKIYTE